MNIIIASIIRVEDVCAASFVLLSFYLVGFLLHRRVSVFQQDVSGSWTLRRRSLHCRERYWLAPKLSAHGDT